MKYKNPANDYTEEIYGPFSWLWVALLGPLYWAIKGVWIHAVVHLVLSIIALNIGYKIAFGVAFRMIYSAATSAAVTEDFSGFFFFLSWSYLLFPTFSLVPYLVVGLIYAYFTDTILEKHYDRKGWVKVKEDKKVASPPTLNPK